MLLFIVAGLLNLRGSDIDYNPVFFSYLMVTRTDVNLYIDPSKVTQAVHNHFTAEDLNVVFHHYNKIFTHLTEMVQYNKSVETV